MIVCIKVNWAVALWICARIVYIFIGVWMPTDDAGSSL